LSPSGPPRRAGLDPTTCKNSKRITSDGRERWPSTEAVSKVLAATDTSIYSFVQLIGNGARQAASVPQMMLAEAAQHGHFDDHGHPAGKAWSDIALPAANADQLFALSISGEAFEPAYRGGDVLLMSPATATRRGDRVAVKTAGEILIGELKRRSAKVVELTVLGAAPGGRTLAASDVEWIARIVWASQ